jgi:WD40 repeat protein
MDNIAMVNTVGFLPDGKKLISASYDGLKIWNLETDKNEANYSFGEVNYY